MVEQAERCVGGWCWSGLMELAVRQLASHVNMTTTRRCRRYLDDQSTALASDAWTLVSMGPNSPASTPYCMGTTVLSVHTRTNHTRRATIVSTPHEYVSTYT